MNGAPGLLLDTGEYPSVIAFSIDQGRISEIDVVPPREAGDAARLG
jgi:hypothetical protein